MDVPADGIIDGTTFVRCSADAEGHFAIPEGVTMIGVAAFDRCERLTSVHVPDGVEGICGSAFRYCSSLTSVRLPDGLRLIAQAAFAGCPSLTDVTIPHGVEAIGDFAFSRCSSLAFINVPESVASIGYRAFAGCDHLALAVVSPLTASKADSFPAECKIYEEIGECRKHLAMTLADERRGEDVQVVGMHEPGRAARSVSSSDSDILL